MFEVFGFGKPMEHQADHGDAGRAVGHVGPAGAHDRRPPRRRARRDPRDLREGRHPAHARGGGGHDRSGHRRRGALRDHRRRRTDATRSSSSTSTAWRRTSRPSGRPRGATAPTASRSRATPTSRCELTVGKPETASDDGMVATTMRLVNAIPYVCDAPAGLTTLPRPPPHHPQVRLPLTQYRGCVARTCYDTVAATQPCRRRGGSGGAEGAGVGGGDGGLEGAVVEGVGDGRERRCRGRRSRPARWRAPGRR